MTSHQPVFQTSDVFVHVMFDESNRPLYKWAKQNCLSEVALAFAVFIQDCNSIHFFSEANWFSCISEVEFTAENIRAASVRHSCLNSQQLGLRSTGNSRKFFSLQFQSSFRLYINLVIELQVICPAMTLLSLSPTRKYPRFPSLIKLLAI